MPAARKTIGPLKCVHIRRHGIQEGQGDRRTTLAPNQILVPVIQSVCLLTSLPYWTCEHDPDDGVFYLPRSAVT